MWGESCSQPLRKCEQSSNPHEWDLHLLGMVPSVSCLRLGSRSRGSTLVLVPVWAEAGVSLYPCQGWACWQPNLPRGDLYSASSPQVPLPRADGVGFTLYDGIWLPQEGDSWQNLGSCSAGGREQEMRPGRDTSHEMRIGLGAGKPKLVPRSHLGVCLCVCAVAGLLLSPMRGCPGSQEAS